jgi:hypothetical protein
MKKLKKFGAKSLIIAALLAAPFAFGQGSPSTIPMPANLTLTGGAGGASTNLALGWSSSTITTNINPFWSVTNSPPTILYTTNYSTNTVTSFADFDAIGQDYVAIQQAFNCNTLNSNVWYSVARSADKRIWDTTANLSRTNLSNGSTNVCDIFQIDMRGYPYGRIMSINWSNTSASCTFSNGVQNVIAGVTNTVPGFQYWKPVRRTTTSGN